MVATRPTNRNQTRIARIPHIMTSPTATLPQRPPTPQSVPWSRSASRRDLPGNVLHVQPVRTGSDIDSQRHIELERTGHFVASKFRHTRHFFWRSLKHKFVVNGK